MEKKTPQKSKPLIWFLLALAAIAIAYGIFSLRGDDRLNEALAAYQRGEKATTVAEREKAFNEALALYLKIAEEYPTAMGDGTLQYDIANSYFQLGAYPWAVLYYYKALKLDPTNERAEQNLKITLAKLDRKEEVPQAPWQQFITLSSFLSIAERFQLFFAFSSAAIVFGALYIFKRMSTILGAAYLSGALAAIFLVSITLSWYGSYPQAVVLKATMLYRDAGKQYAKVQEQPVAPGSKVDILDTAADGKWVMVDVGGSVIGYIPVENIGMI